MKCIKGFEVKVLNSAAGYYIGTLDEENFPMCRISSYYKTKEAAQRALDKFTFHRFAEEINFCNHGYECIPPQGPFTLCGEDGQNPGEFELEFGELDEAINRADAIRDDGGWAYVTDALGREYN